MTSVYDSRIGIFVPIRWAFSLGAGRADGAAWEKDVRVKLPLSVQAHHARMDDVHVGQYFNTIQEIFDHPDKYLGSPPGMSSIQHP